MRSSISRLFDLVLKQADPVPISVPVPVPLLAEGRIPEVRDKWLSAYATGFRKPSKKAQPGYGRMLDRFLDTVWTAPRPQKVTAKGEMILRAMMASRPYFTRGGSFEPKNDELVDIDLVSQYAPPGASVEKNRTAQRYRYSPERQILDIPASPSLSGAAHELTHAWDKYLARNLKWTPSRVKHSVGIAQMTTRTPGQPFSSMDTGRVELLASLIDAKLSGHAARNANRYPAFAWIMANGPKYTSEMDQRHKLAETVRWLQKIYIPGSVENIALRQMPHVAGMPSKGS